MLTATASRPTYGTPAHTTVTGRFREAYAEILTTEALVFLEALHIRFNPRRLDLLQKRIERQARIDGGELPDFLPETENIRSSDWTIAPLPKDLQDRRVEITALSNRVRGCGAETPMPGASRPAPKTGTRYAKGRKQRRSRHV